MKRFNGFFDYSIFFLIGFLSFLTLFESFIRIPETIQVVGRLHPLILHFPIGFLALLALLPLVKSSFPEESYRSLELFVLRLSLLALLTTGVAGLFLAQETGYESSLVNWHKYGAIILCFLGYGLLLLKKQLPQRHLLYQIGLYTSLAVLLLTGHLGGSITHGKDFLLEPLKANKKEVGPQSSLFEAAIQPILQEKCSKCHNNSKQKGGLSMHDTEALLRGGKNGPIWKAGQTDRSHLLQRIHLPLSAEEHMPPEGQKQLSQQELNIIYHWIKDGADMEANIASLEQQDSLYLALNSYLQERQTSLTATNYSAIQPADASLVRQLNTPYRTVRPIAAGSPALSVAFYIQQAFEPSFLEELSELRNQIVSINLSNMPIEDETLELLAKFPHLEKAILNGTPITGSSLASLSSCTNLKEIAISNTDIKLAEFMVFSKFPRLETVYAWETLLQPEDLEKLATRLPNIHFELGYQPSPEEVLQLSPPQLKNDQLVLEKGEQVVLSTKFPGAEIRYTTDGSDPDSLASPLFSNPLTLTDLTTIKAQTFSQGWLASEIVTFTLFPPGKTPDTTVLLSEPNPAYRGGGPEILTDKEKGKIGNFRTDAWLGFQKQSLSVLFKFENTPPQISRVVGSFGQNMGPEIFLPKEVRVYGGLQPDRMELLGSTKPQLPEGYQPNKIEGITIKFKASDFPYYRLEALAYPSLPQWHQSYASGRKTWVFIDEVFFY